VSKEEIIRLAKGCDNSPMTMRVTPRTGIAMDSNHSWKDKLSLGLAKVPRTPPDIHGINLRSETAEAKAMAKAPAKPRALYVWMERVTCWSEAWATLNLRC